MHARRCKLGNIFLLVSQLLWLYRRANKKICDFDLCYSLQTNLEASCVLLEIPYKKESICERLQMRRTWCVMSESSHKCNIIWFHSMNFIIALTGWVYHTQIARFS